MAIISIVACPLKAEKKMGSTHSHGIKNPPKIDIAK